MTELSEWEVTRCERTSKKWLRRTRWRVATRPDGTTILDGILHRESAERMVKEHNATMQSFKDIAAKLDRHDEQIHEAINAAGA